MYMLCTIITTIIIRTAYIDAAIELSLIVLITPVKKGLNNYGYKSKQTINSK